ncbi:MAG: type II toxin-antitoxin system VapC family toxin [Parvibaculaceae bacterium]
MATWVTIDASVLVKAFVREKDSDKADALFASDTVLIAPAHALAEVGDVLYRKLRGGQITEEQLRLAYIGLPGSFQPVPLESILQQAIEVAIEIEHSVYDCLYLVVAQRHDCQLVTADTKFVAKVRQTRFGSRVVNLADFAVAG